MRHELPRGEPVHGAADLRLEGRGVGPHEAEEAGHDAVVPPRREHGAEAGVREVDEERAPEGPELCGGASEHALGGGVRRADAAVGGPEEDAVRRPVVELVVAGLDLGDARALGGEDERRDQGQRLREVREVGVGHEAVGLGVHPAEGVHRAHQEGRDGDGHRGERVAEGLGGDEEERAHEDVGVVQRPERNRARCEGGGGPGEGARVEPRVSPACQEQQTDRQDRHATQEVGDEPVHPDVREGGRQRAAHQQAAQGRPEERGHQGAEQQRPRHHRRPVLAEVVEAAEQRGTDDDLEQVGRHEGEHAEQGIPGDPVGHRHPGREGEQQPRPLPPGAGEQDTHAERVRQPDRGDVVVEPRERQGHEREDQEGGAGRGDDAGDARAGRGRGAPRGRALRLCQSARPSSVAP